MLVRRYIDKSIQRQFVTAFFLILAGTVMFNVLINETLLEKYYIANRQRVLKAAYQSINTTFTQGGMDSDDFDIEVQRISGIYNTDVLIMDSDLQVLVASEHEIGLLAYELQGYIFGQIFDMENPSVQVLEEAGEYTIQNSYDDRTGINYLEMWGFLDSGNPFIIRTAMEGIRESVKIANRFLIYAGLLAAAVGTILIYLVTRKVTRPILELAGLSRRMADLDFEVRYEGKDTNEIGVLGSDMNRLSEKLEQTVSELKTANTSLKNDIEKKEKIDRMRSEFISDVSHELKTPLALIMGYAEGLKMDVNDDPESRDYYCEVISDEANKMNKMVRELLNVSQLESGSDLVSMKRFDITELISGVIRSSAIITEGIGADIVFGADEPVYVWGDEFRVEEVVTNYLTNAVNHVSGENKRIEVNIEQTDDGHARITVFNTGDPIPDDAIEHIWEKFYKVDKARSREYGGSGIGLSIVKAIMESMNQKFGVENCEDGVKFWFELETKS